MSSGTIMVTSPSIQPKPSCVPFSRPRLAMSCMPTQMPRNGTPAPITRSSSVSRMPVTASNPARQSAKAPTPGRTMRSALRTFSGSSVTRDLGIKPGFARRTLKSLGRRFEIARAVIDDGDAFAHPSLSSSQSRSARYSSSATRVPAGMLPRRFSVASLRSLAAKPIHTREQTHRARKPPRRRETGRRPISAIVSTIQPKLSSHKPCDQGPDTGGTSAAPQENLSAKR